MDVFRFGWADRPDKRSLVQMRKRVRWFSDDVVSSKEHGLVGIGAIPYMTNFNVTLDTSMTSVVNEDINISAVTTFRRP